MNSLNGRFLVHFKMKASFKKWYSPMVTPMEETELVEILANYEEQGKLSDVVKYLFITNMLN